MEIIAVNSIGQPERATQNRVIALFCNELGYRFLGDWTDRADNSNIDEKLLTAWLAKRGVTGLQIAIALHRLRTQADNHHRGLYGNYQVIGNKLVSTGPAIGPRECLGPVVSNGPIYFTSQTGG